MIVELVTVNSSNLAIYLNLTQAYEAEFSPLTKKLPDEEGKFTLDTPIEGTLLAIYCTLMVHLLG